MEREISTVAIYVRKSREDETDETLNRQEAVLVDLCVKNLWKYEIYKEVGSSQDLDRPQLQEMLDKVKLFYFDAIVVADLDRLSRNTVHFGMIKETLMNYGCLVYASGKLYDFTKQEDDLFSDLQSVLAKNEYQNIKKRLVRGTRQSAKDGNWLGKKSPIGYKYNRDTKRLEPSSDASIIKRLFYEYIDGLSTTDIALKFTHENIQTTKGLIWTSSGISRLLNNPVYVGNSVYGRTTTKLGKRGVKTKKDDQIIVENTHEPIIDKETWDLVQEIKSKRNSRPISIRLAKHTFSGLIVCGLCGSKHSFQKARGGKLRITSCQTRYYKNGSLNNYTVCENQSGNLDKFELLFYAILELYIEELIKKRDSIYKLNKPKQNNTQSQKSHFEKQIKKIQQDIKRIQQGFIMEIFTEREAQEQIKGLNVQKDSVEKEIERLNKVDNESEVDFLTKIINNLKAFMQGKSNMSESEENEILSKYIHQIKYIKLSNEMKLNVDWVTKV